MMFLQVDPYPTYQFLKDLTGTGLFIVGAVFVIRYLMNKQEESDNNRDKMLEKMQADYKDNQQKIMDMHERTIESHEECNQKYLELSAKYQETINNNTRAIEKLTDKLDK